MRYRITLLFVFLPLLLLEVACFGTRPPVRRANSALDFLYPQGYIGAKPASEVVLQLPLRVGLAFAPNRNNQADPITEEQKQKLLNEVAAAFKDHQRLGHLEVVPASYLQPGGGFANLEQMRLMLGLDLMVLLSYDQTQFTESTRASWTYLTVVGPLLIEGDRNDTRTVIDAVVYDIPSQALLFRAAGESTVKGWSSPYNVSRKRRKHAAEGFEKATDRLISELNGALARFESQAASGKVQGPGTPQLAVYNEAGQRINLPKETWGSGPGGGGGGALCPQDLILAALLGLAAILAACCRHIRRT